jgi:peptidoglycan hydrolase-like protein with peptidoglycan-binding domain
VTRPRAGFGAVLKGCERLLPLLVLLCLPVTEAWPATRDRIPPQEFTQRGEEELFFGNKTVLRIQKVLFEEGRYNGRLDGRMSPELKSAIRAYQKRNRLKVDGEASEELAKRMETHDRVQVLLNKLERARREDLERARLALLSDPRTRHLIEQAEPERADPTRDPSACFAKPTPGCLLNEASESAKAIAKTDRRDWALGEILAAQAKAGFIEEAMATTERISDLRLVIVALRTIAAAQARAGRYERAEEAADTIPDAPERLVAMIKIAEIALENFQQKLNDKGPAIAAAKKVLTAAADLPTLDGISAASRAISVLASLSENEVAKNAVDDLAERVERFTPKEKRSDAYRHLSSAHAALGDSASALETLKKYSKTADPTPLLVSAANAHLRDGDSESALNAAFGITADRYLAVVLARVAVSLHSQNKRAEAKETLEQAIKTADDIPLPFAKAYARSRIALGWVRVGSAERGISAAESVSDNRIRAQTLWSIVMELKAGPLRDQTTEKAWEASNAIKSAFSRSWILAEVASSHATRKEPVTARETFMVALSIADTVTNPWARARVLGKLADTLVDLGR